MKKLVTIIVNAMPKEVEKGVISFTDVVRLFDPSYTAASKIVYSVEYENGRGNTKEGILAKGGEVKIKEETEFTVSKTGES